jgi:hypothetical protein
VENCSVNFVLPGVEAGIGMNGDGLKVFGAKLVEEAGDNPEPRISIRLDPEVRQADEQGGRPYFGDIVRRPAREVCD